MESRSEYRQNSITRQLVLIVNKKGKEDVSCPFCGGNFNIIDRTENILAVPYPEHFLYIESCKEGEGCEPFGDRIPNFGVQEALFCHEHEINESKKELIIESLTLAKRRYCALRNDPRIEFLLWRQRKEKHFLSEILGSPFITHNVKEEINGSSEYFKMEDRCGWCDIANEESKKEESRSENRVVAKNPNFIAFCPWASTQSFEVLVLPRKHIANFGATPDNLFGELAEILTIATSAIEKVAATFGFSLHSAPLKKTHHLGPEIIQVEDCFHWHFHCSGNVSDWDKSIDGLPMKTLSPEDEAKLLREVIGQ